MKSLRALLHKAEQEQEPDPIPAEAPSKLRQAMGLLLAQAMQQIAQSGGMEGRALAMLANAGQTFFLRMTNDQCDEWANALFKISDELRRVQTLDHADTSSNSPAKPALSVVGSGEK